MLPRYSCSPEDLPWDHCRNAWKLDFSWFPSSSIVAAQTTSQLNVTQVLILGLPACLREKVNTRVF